MFLSEEQINGLFVHPYRGIGRALIDHAKERHGRLELFCLVDSYPAQRFYHARGFDISDDKSNDRLAFDEYVMT
ncbi:GNAT family N-acetyltransferase [Reinekea sp.]|jgi:ribosomal protein S18 acetylase RimI-like enzyme|uniref:GNAT family N-acetyltransferase n=1 Tax=Reinekea sp. TaxID=1970455 RepID=UPI002A7FD85C|nr:GNAT family N-acetyltransferase [Reinekea sp.]